MKLPGQYTYALVDHNNQLALYGQVGSTRSGLVFAPKRYSQYRLGLYKHKLFTHLGQLKGKHLKRRNWR